MKVKGRYIWLGILCVYFAAVLLLCLMKPDSLPKPSIDLWGIPLDKAAHFLMFFPYPIIAYIAFRPESSRKRHHLLVLVAVFVLGLGLAIGTEKLQGLSEYRSYELTDYYADVFGMECSAFLTFLYIIFRKERKDNR